MIAGPAVLCLHNVMPTWANPLGRADERAFEAFVRSLLRVYRIVSLGDAVSPSGRASRWREIALTFDDGFKDNVEVAAPVLTKLGVPATFFLVNEFLSGELVPWWESVAWAVKEDSSAATSGSQEREPAGLASTLDELKRLTHASRRKRVQEIIASARPVVPFEQKSPMMDWGDAAKLLDLGFEVGSHTLAHAILARETADEQRRQMVESKLELERRLGTKVAHLAYPNGGSDDQNDLTLQIAEAAGYDSAATTVRGRIGPHTRRSAIPRLVVHPHRRTHAHASIIRALTAPVIRERGR